MRRSLRTLVLLPCLVSVACFRHLHDSDMVGTYKATADWGTSTLVLSADHTFKQSISTNSGVFRQVQGRWELFGHDGIEFREKYLSVSHDTQGEETNWAFASAERGLFGGVEISADPDYGIAFRK